MTIGYSSRSFSITFIERFIVAISIFSFAIFYASAQDQTIHPTETFSRTVSSSLPTSALSRLGVTNEPRVLIITSNASCDKSVPADDLRTTINSDVDLLRSIFDQTIVKENTTRSDLKDFLTSRFQSADGVRSGLVIIYLGHGVLNKDSNPSYKLSFPENGSLTPKKGYSYLCLSDGLVPPSDIIDWLPNDLPWAALILNTCESANVDVSNAVIPISVISASPDEVFPSLEQPQSERSGGSDFIRALGEILERSPSIDENCDEVISDQEIFEVLVRKFRRWSHLNLPKDSFPPLPKIRRQATSHIPLYSVRKTDKCEKVIDAIKALPQTKDGKLSAELNRQIRLSTNHRDSSTPVVLPDLTRDYFYLQDIDHHRACLGNSDPSLIYRSICSAAKNHGLDPIPEELIGDVDDPIERLANIARFTSFTDVFFIQSESNWIHVKRLRDDVLVSTRRFENIDTAIPQRSSVVMTWDEGKRYIKRFSRKAPERASENSIPVSCAQGDGQCFYYEKPADTKGRR
jgi:hypothetical protein